jgi:polyphenol oxidase
VNDYDGKVRVRGMNPAAHGNVALVLTEAERYSGVMAFSLRTGGCSPPPFEALNFSVQHGDSIENVQENLNVLGARLGIEPARIVTCRQVHGDDIAVLDSLPTSRPAVDALVTRVPQLYPAVKTADCVPILLLDPVGGVSAAVHAGWRGTVKRITGRVLRLMQRRFRTRTENVIAAVGPSIGSCCYEVDAAVLVPFRRNIPEADRFISNATPAGHDTQRAHLDLIGVNHTELIAEGVSPQKIHVADCCTCCNPGLFFSYRRDGLRSGRHIAVTGFR